MPKILTEGDFGLEGKPADTPKPTAIKDEDIAVGGPEDQIGLKKEEPKKPKSDKLDKGGREKPKEEAPKFKYSSQEQAEEAEKEASKRMHKATEEAAMLRKLLLDQNLKHSDTQDIDEAEKIADETIAEIRKLDSEDKDYDQKCARLWAKAQRKIANLEVSKHSKEKESRDVANRDLEDRVNDALKEAGFTSDWDKKAFAVMANYVPANITDQDEQIEWVVKQIAEYRKSIITETTKKSEEEEEERKELKVLGKGAIKKGAGREEPEEHQPKTLGEQLKELKQKRRISNKD